jgi:hypothetical protein
VLARTAPRAVWIDGRRVERASSLERERVGWTFTDGPFGGVVVKLDGPAKVEIDAGR